MKSNEISAIAWFCMLRAFFEMTIILNNILWLIFNVMLQINCFPKGNVSWVQNNVFPACLSVYNEMVCLSPGKVTNF